MLYLHLVVTCSFQVSVRIIHLVIYIVTYSNRGLLDIEFNYKMLRIITR